MLDRSKPPVFNRDFSFDLIKPGHVRLSNGADAWFIHGGDQHVIKVELVFTAGRWYDTLPGAGYFTAHLLNKGTAGKTGFEIASRFDQLGAHLEIHPGADFITLALYTLTKKLGPALELLSEILLQPVFDEKELQQLRSIYLQNLEVNQEKTSFLATNAFRAAVFGHDHPYGKELERSDVDALARHDLADFHKRFFRDFTILVSGRIDDTSRQAIADTFGSFAFAPVSPRQIAESVMLPARRHTEKEGSIQTSLRIGKKTILRAHPDFPALLLLTHILGGYFGSRLMKNIREEKGLTYGIHASLRPMKHHSYLAIGTDVNRENRDLAFAEIRKELQQLCETPVGAGELDTARCHFIGSLQAELSTAFAHADKIRNIVLYDLEKDHYATLIRRIDRLTPQDLQQTANLYFRQDSFFEISAG